MLWEEIHTCTSKKCASGRRLIRQVDYKKNLVFFRLANELQIPCLNNGRKKFNKVICVTTLSLPSSKTGEILASGFTGSSIFALALPMHKHNYLRINYYG